MSELLNTIVATGIKVVIALVALIVAFKIINFLSRKISKKLESNEKLDKTLIRTLAGACSIGMKILVVIALIGYLGIETSGFSALIASLGVCIGLAVNGTLSNLAGGVMLLLTRPFNVGDYIEGQGQQGTVENLGICYTTIKTVDEKIVHLPNSALSTGTIINYSSSDNRRVDFNLSVAGNDPEQVKSLLLDIADNESLVLKDPAPFARVLDYGTGNGLKVTFRCYCKSSDYWDTFFNLNEAIEKKFSENGIVIPFNQLDVHIKDK